MAVLQQLLAERAAAVELGRVVELEVERDDADADRLVALRQRRMLLSQLVHLRDEVQLLIEGEVDREFVAPVDDLRVVRGSVSRPCGLSWITEISSGRTSPRSWPISTPTVCSPTVRGDWKREEKCVDMVTP